METIKLDLIPGKKMPSLHASQYDDGREHGIDLFENGAVYKLDGTETLTINERKGDDCICSLDIENTFAGSNHIVFASTEQMCAVWGNNICELVIKRGSVTLGTLNFILEIEPSPTEGGIESKSEIRNLETQVTDIVNEVVPEIIGENYYDKEQTDELLDNKANKNETYTKEEVDENVSDAIYDILPSELTPTGAIANFSTTLEMPLKIEVDNTATKVLKRGTNLWNEVVELGALNSDGTLNGQTTRITTDFIAVKPNQTYRQSSLISAYGGRICFYDINKSCVRYDGNGVRESTRTFTTQDGECYVRITLGFQYGTAYNNDISINYPSTDTEYHAYHGEEYPIAEKDNIIPFVGVNNIFTDSGDVAVEYKVRPTADKDTNTWRAIKVEGVEKLGNGINSGAVDVVGSANIEVSFDTNGNKIKLATKNLYNKNEVDTALSGKASATEVENIRIGVDGTTYASAGVAVREQIGDLKGVLFGLTKTVTETSSGNYKISSLLLAGKSYSLTNNTSAGITARLFKSDGTEVSLPSITQGNKLVFTIPDDGEYVAVGGYANAAGTINLSSSYSAIDELDDLVTVGGIQLYPGYITTSGTIAGQDTTRLEVYTNRIKAKKGYKFNLKLTFGSENQMWCAYALYDENGQFISRTTLDNGFQRKYGSYDVTIDAENAYYVAFTFRTYGNCESTIKSYMLTQTLQEDVQDLQSKQAADLVTTVRSINHRGFNTVAPENTLPAYKLSRKMGFKCVETDVAFTSDGVAVLLHDGTINRTARNPDGTTISSSIAIGSITYTQALNYDFGIWKSSEYAGTKIPTFLEFITLCKRIGLDAYIELKPTGTTEARAQGLIDVVKACGMKNHVSWISFYPNLLTYVKNYDSTARIGVLTETVDSTLIDTAQALKTSDNEVFIDSDVYNSSAISLCLGADLPLEAWTINSETNMKNLDAYISGVTSDSLIFGKVLYDSYI